MMRYRLRTLLILLGVLPPILAGAWFLVTEFLFVLPVVFCFAIFWLICGLIWLAIMRVLDRFLEERPE